MKRLVIAVLLLCFAMPAMAQVGIFEEHFDTLESMDNWVDESKFGTQYYWQDGKVFQDITWTQRDTRGYGYLTYFGPDGQGLDIPDSFVATWKIYDYGQMDQPAYMTWMKWNATGVDPLYTIPLTGALAGLQLLTNNWGVTHVHKDGVRLDVPGGTPWSTPGYDPLILPVSTVRLEVLQSPTDPTQWTITCYFNDVLAFQESEPLLNELVGRVGTFGFVIMGGLYAIDDIVITTHPDAANQPPIADAGPDQTLECTDATGTLVTLDGSNSSDPDSTPGTNDDIESFDWYEGDVLLGSGETLDYTFPLGVHTVTLVVTDSADETDEDEVVITVEDTTPPDISLSVNKNSLWPPNHKMVDVGFTCTVSDNCDEDPEISIEVTSDEPTVTPRWIRRPRFAPDARITDSDMVFLRAERYWRGDGRVYVITVTATDESGNQASSNAVAKVNRRKRKEAIDSGQNYDATEINR